MYVCVCVRVCVCLCVCFTGWLADEQASSELFNSSINEMTNGSLASVHVCHIGNTTG